MEPFENSNVDFNSTNTNQTKPYIILYNKFLGKIRIHAKVGEEWATENYWQSFRVNLVVNGDILGENYNGMLRLLDGIDKPLDQETTVREYTALCEANNVKNQWFVAEFQVAFDPCVCKWPSSLSFNYDLVRNDTLTLHGGGIEIEKEIIGGANDAELLHGDYLSNFKKHGPSDAEGGFVIYGEMQSLIDGYIKKLEIHDSILADNTIHNKKVKRNLAILKWGSIAVKLGANLVTAGGANALTFAILATEAPELIINGDSVDVNKAFLALEKILGSELKTFIGESFKQKDPPEKPIRPTANFSEMYFKGNIFTSAATPGPTLITPGAYGNSVTGNITNPSRYPVYNEPLGVFALLESPKINVSRTFKDFSCEVYKSTPFSDFDYWPDAPYEGEETYDLNQANIEEEIQLQLAEELKYTFNSSLTIKNYTIETSFIVEGGLKLSNNPYSNSLSYSSDESTQIISLPNRNINIESTSFNPKEIEVYKDNNIIFDDLDYQTLHVPVDALYSSTFSFGINKKFTETPLWITRKDRINDIINRPYSSCSFINEILKKDAVTSYEIGDVYLKLIINVTFEGEKTDGSPHEYTYVFTYKIDPDDIDDSFTSPLYPNLSGSPADITQYPENLFFDGTNFDGSQIENCTLNDTIYTCKAWNEISLSGDFIFSSGYNVVIEAGNEIITVPESTIPTEMIWQIVPVLDYSNPMPPVDETYVTNFCKVSGAYKARTSNMPLFNNDSTIVYEEDIRDIFAFNIFPNPTSGSSAVSITLNESAKGELFITDMNGRTLATAFSGRALRAGQTEHQLPTASLASGIYLVHLFIGGERHVKRLVKQ